MKRNSLLTVGAALTIASAAVVGGYFVDRMPTQSVNLETAAVTTPSTVTTASSAVKHTAKPATVATATPPAPSTMTTVTPLRDAVADKALVAVSGTVTDKKGNVLTLKEASGPVRVVVREDAPQPWQAARTVSAMDKIDVGETLTVYGKVRTNETMPKVYADAVYDPATKTLYHVNGDRPANEVDGKAMMARYTPVDNVRTTKLTSSKVTATKVTTER